MRSILEELFYGNVCPNTDCRSKDKETKELIGYIADHHHDLSATLNDKQKELFEKSGLELTKWSIIYWCLLFLEIKFLSFMVNVIVYPSILEALSLPETSSHKYFKFSFII